MSEICNHCKTSFIRKPEGRAPSHCSNACRQAAYRLRVKTLRIAGIKSNKKPALRIAGTHYKQIHILDLLGLA